MCENFVVQMLMSHLQMRKKLIGKWIVSLSDWIVLMNLETLKPWISCLPVTIVNSIIESAMSQIRHARDRDLVLCILTISMNPRMSKFNLSKDLTYDETSRLYLLKLLTDPLSTTGLNTLSFNCYSQEKVFYISDQVEHAVYWKVTF